MYDVVIIGGGAAGLSAAIYSGRKELKTLVVSKEYGGLTTWTNNIENYPGFDGGSGLDLMNIMKKQAERFWAELVVGDVKSIQKKGKNFLVELVKDRKKYETKTLILAYGKVHRELGIPGEKEFMGKGVSVCVTCDGPFFANKTVAVVGGGNAAVEGVLFLSKIAKKVYLAHRSERFRADEISVGKMKKLKNVEMMLNSKLKEIKGKDNLVKSIIITNNKTKEEKKIDVSGVFLEIGFEIKTDLIKGLVKLNKRNEIIVDERKRTSQPGIFAAGDLTIVPYKQTVIAAGEGATAALEAYRYLYGPEKV